PRDGIQVSGIVLIVIDDKHIMVGIAIGLGANAGDATASLERSLMTIKRPGYVPPKNALWDAPPGVKPGVPVNKTHLSMINDYGTDRIATITVQGAHMEPMQHHHIDKVIGEAAGPGARVYGRGAFDEYLVFVAPVDDVTQLSAKLDLGQVANVDQKNRSFTLRVDEDKLPSFEKEMQEKMREAREGFGGFTRGGSATPAITDPDDPNFFKQNLANVRSTDTFLRDEALQHLVNVDTAKLADPQMRKDIAQAIRAVAFDNKERSNVRCTAIRGLVHWGGKFAGPILVQLLQLDEPFLEAEICRQLAVLKEPAAIDLLVAKIMDLGPHREEFAKCLIAYGPLAEDSILANTRAQEPMTTSLILQVLAQIGTKKSLPALKALRNLYFANIIAGDLQRAVQMIEQREKQRRSAPDPHPVAQ
ncbi:MAG: HEAT repeat domain-containing protein, partial [Thermoguttaceae bacterium]